MIRVWARALQWVLVFACGAAGASAQDYSYPTPPPQDQPYTTEPAFTPAPPPSVGSQRGFQGGFNIGVPLFFDVDSDVVRPGADLHGFGGYEIGYLVLGLDLGVMWTPINLDAVPNVPLGTDVSRSPVTRLYFAPEVRVQIPNKSRILPYLGATFDVNFWRFRETELACNVWYCTTVAVFRFTPGFTGKLGVAFRVTSGMYIDVGVKYSLSGPGNFFDERQQWITPYVGVLGR